MTDNWRTQAELFACWPESIGTSPGDITRGIRPSSADVCISPRTWMTIYVYHSSSELSSEHSLLIATEHLQPAMWLSTGGYVLSWH